MKPTRKQKQQLTWLLIALVILGISFVYFVYIRCFIGYSLSLAMAIGVMFGLRDVSDQIDNN